MPAAAPTSQNALTSDTLHKDDIRWAQVELHIRGLYEGSLDGILGPETTRALNRFQKMNELEATASLDAQTWEALTSPAMGERSSSARR